jgi:dipeptidyl aminopeptidase/acylaminoacyl peptidase
LTHVPQHLANARFAPDGHAVLFSAARVGNTSELFLWRPDEPQPRLLSGKETQLLSVSSSGELAVLVRATYLYHRTYVGTLARMPIAEVTPREVLEDVSDADWSPDGRELAVVRRQAGRSLLEYPVGKVLAESSGYLSDVRLSPDGNHVAFISHDLPEDNRGPVVVLDRTGAEIVRSPEYKGVMGLAWAGDGKSIYFTAHGAELGYSVRALALDGVVRDALTAPVDLVIHDLLPGGKALLSSDASQRHFGSRRAGEASERVQSSSGAACPVALTADGRGTLFTDESVFAGNNYSVGFQADPDAPPVRLGEGNAEDLSPDGTTVIAAVPSNPPRLMLYPIGPGSVRDISIEGFASYKDAGFVPGTGQVFVCGSEAGKGQRCYVRDLGSGEVRAVTPDGTMSGRVSADGKFMAARQADGQWHRYPLDGGPGQPIAGLAPGDDIIRWSADGESLLTYNPLIVPARIERLDLGSGRRTLRWEMGVSDPVGVIRFWSAVVSADEKSYAYCFDRVLSVLHTVEKF